MSDQLLCNNRSHTHILPFLYLNLPGYAEVFLRHSAVNLTFKVFNDLRPPLLPPLLQE